MGKHRQQIGRACHVEGIEGHLCGGLADALPSQDTHRLARGRQAAQKLELHELREALR